MKKTSSGIIKPADSPNRIRRRTVLKAGAAGATAAAIGFPAIAQQRTIRIGYVSPQTGALAAMAEADDFTINTVMEHIGQGLSIDGRVYPVEILVRDSQSNPNRAADVANELILADEIDLMVVGSTPENANPVADACEVNEVPCLSSMAPWQSWFFTRGGTPDRGFDWAYHYFWGLEDIVAVFCNMWDKLDTNGQVGGLFPNDADGNALGDPNTGFPPLMRERGYTITDPGRYQNFNDDFTAFISAFRSADSEIVTGVPLPPDFATFWNQARQQGFRPKAVSVGKATLYPSNVEALGDAGDRLSSEIWWSPTHPFVSSLTGQTGREVADAYTAATGRQWTQPIGFIHSMFEIAVDIMTRAGGPGDYEATRDALAATNLDTLVGPVSWGNGPVPNVCKTPLVGGQWKLDRNRRFPWEIVVVSNETAPSVPLGGEMEPLPQA